MELMNHGIILFLIVWNISRLFYMGAEPVFDPSES